MSGVSAKSEASPPIWEQVLEVPTTCLFSLFSLFRDQIESSVAKRAADVGCLVLFSRANDTFGQAKPKGTFGLYFWGGPGRALFTKYLVDFVHYCFSVLVPLVLAHTDVFKKLQLILL